MRSFYQVTIMYINLMETVTKLIQPYHGLKLNHVAVDNINKNMDHPQNIYINWLKQKIRKHLYS